MREFFDSAQNDPRLSSKFFNARTKVKPDNTTPSLPQDIDYKADPLSYLRMVKKEKGFEAYQQEVNRLSREGLIN